MHQFEFSFLHPELRLIPCEKEVVKLEAMLGIRLPADYKVFLLEFGGAWLGSSIEFPIKQLEEGEVIGVEEFYGFYQPNEIGRRQPGDLFFRIEMYQKRMPSNLLPIAGAFYGNQVCVCFKGDSKGRIFYWDHEKLPNEDDRLLLVAESFDLFIRSGSKVDN